MVISPEVSLGKGAKLEDPHAYFGRPEDVREKSFVPSCFDIIMISRHIIQVGQVCGASHVVV